MYSLIFIIQVNELREELRLAKLKTKEIFTESREFSEYIDKKREKRHNQIISINDDQQNMLNKLDEQEKEAQVRIKLELWTH